MTEEAKKATEAGVCIHYLQYGEAPCGMVGVPRDWPDGNVWVRDWGDVNCQGCLRTVLPALELWFNERADRWEKESRIHSSPGEKFFHRDLISIMTKGELVVPFILKRLSKTKSWLWALELIIDETDNPAKGIRDSTAAVKAWIDWGRDRYSSHVLPCNPCGQPTHYCDPPDAPA